MFEKYKILFTSFLKDKWFLFSTLACITMAYSFYIFNFSPNVEDLFFDIYYGNNNLLVSVGRFGTVIIDKLLGISFLVP